MIIRLLLIGAVLLAAAYALRSETSGRGLAIRRIALAGFTAAWIAAVISPDLLSWLATKVGVVRGTDLLLYALVVAVLLLAIGVYQRINRLEGRVADLTRELAITTASSSMDEPGGRVLSIVPDEARPGQIAQ